MKGYVIISVFPLVCMWKCPWQDTEPQNYSQFAGRHSAWPSPSVYE